MKKILLTVIMVLALSASYSFAHMDMADEQKGEMKQHGMMGEGHMMQMCVPAMKHMTGQGMMMQDMMQMMMDMMKMQKKMMKGMGPAEKRKMMMDMDKMIEKMEKMDKMMSETRGMMMHGVQETSPEKNGIPANEQSPKSEPHKH